MAEYLDAPDVDADDPDGERDPVMILSAVPAADQPHFGRGIDIAAIDGQLGSTDDDFMFAADDDTADTDPLGGINPYVDV